jgi:hypothetical protein
VSATDLVLRLVALFDQLEVSYIRHWTTQHGTENLFEELLRRAGPASP